MASLAAALLGGEPLVSLLGDGQTDSLSSGQGHPRLVALETEDGEGKLLISVDQKLLSQVMTGTWCVFVIRYFTKRFLQSGEMTKITYIH